MKFDNSKIEKIGIMALYKSSKMHDALGAKGVKVLEKNRYGDRKMSGDSECENAVIDALRSKI